MPKKTVIIFFLTITFISSIGQNADSYYKMGLFKYNIRDYDAALRDFTRTAQISPSYEKVYEMLGLIKYRLEDYYGAIDDFTTSLGYFPDDANALYFRGMSKIQVLDYEGALADFEKIHEIFPDNALAYLKSGYVKYLQNEYEEAIAFYDSAIKANDSLGEAFFYRGMSKRQMGDEVDGCIDLNLANKLEYAEAFDEFVESLCN